MTPQTLKTWFPRWFKEWLIPRASQAVAVATVSGVVFATDEETWYTGLARERFNAILEKAGGPVLKSLVIILGAAFLAALLLRGIQNGRGLRFLAFGRLSSLFGTALNTLLGLLLVPLVMSISWTIYGNAPDLTPLKWTLMLYGAAFLLTGAGFHWLSGEGSNPPQHIIYTVSPPASVSSDYARALTQDRLDAVLSHVDLVEKPVVVVHSKNNDLAIVIPFKTTFTDWPENQQQSLFLFLAAVEIEWSADEQWLFTRTLPKEVACASAGRAT